MKTPYHEQMKRCSVTILLRAVIDAEGNQCKAAETLGVHRNLVSRILHEAGWNNEKLMRLAESRNPVLKAKIDVAKRKKPVQSELFNNSVYFRTA